MEKILLSIIVPVYNADKYIGRCIDSLLASKRGDFEVIIVNDGSTDLSGVICKSYLIDSRIRYYEQDNKGVAVARNNGMSHIKGRYFSIVDADDYVAAEYIDTICNDIKKEVDLIIYDHFSGVPSKFACVRVNLLEGVSTNLDKLYSAVFEYRLNAQWDKVFKTDIVKDNDIMFPKDIKAGEDSIFFLQYLQHVKSYYVSRKSVYYYVKNAGSAMANPKLEYINNLNDVFLAYTAFKAKMNISDSDYHILCTALLQSLTKKIVAYKKRKISNECISAELNKTVLYKVLVNLNYSGLKNNVKKYLMKYRLYFVIEKIISDK